MARGLKICLAMFLLFLIICTTVIVTLALTIFKPKDPDISVHLIGLQNFSLSNVTLGMVITIGNPNYGSFKYRNSTGYVHYADTIVAEVPIVTELVPARSKINVSTNADFMVGKLIHDPKFWTDLVGGTLNFTSNTELPGKVSILKFIKLKATAYTSCDISFNITAKDADSKCISKIKL